MTEIATPRGRTLLRGIVGSTAYGLAREGSDVDRLGVFVAPTLEVAGLGWHSSRETHVSTDPDCTMHEIGKYLRLALKCNPTIMELLWLPERLVEYADPIYLSSLLGLRSAVLHAHGVRAAYGGYARQQAQRLANRGDGSFSADTRKRTAKHGRHLLRLLRQGRQLLTTGQLVLAVDNPGEYWAFDHMSSEQMLAVFEREDARFAAARSILPDEPDRERVVRFLDRLRSQMTERASHHDTR